MAGLVTVTDYKEYAGLPSDDPIHDTLLAGFLEASSAVVESWCHRPFARKTCVDWLDGNNSSVVSVTRPPILVLSAVAIYGNGGSGTPTVLEAGDYTMYADSGTVLLAPSLGQSLWGYGRFPRGARNIRVDYEGGFESLPAPVTLAVCLLTSAYYQRRGGDPTVTGESGGGWSRSKQADGQLPSDVVALLAPYKLLLMKTVMGADATSLFGDGEE